MMAVLPAIAQSIPLTFVSTCSSSSFSSFTSSSCCCCFFPLLLLLLLMAVVVGGGGGLLLLLAAAAGEDEDEDEDEAKNPRISCPALFPLGVLPLPLPFSLLLGCVVFTGVVRLRFRSSSAFTDPTAWFGLTAAAALNDHRRGGLGNVGGDGLPPGKGGGKGPSFCCCGCRCCCCCCSFFGRGSWREGQAWRVGFLLVR